MRPHRRDPVVVERCRVQRAQPGRRAVHLGQRHDPVQRDHRAGRQRLEQPIQLEDLASRLTTRLLEPGETLFAQDATDATLYVVASGVLEMTRATGKTTSLTLGRIGAGEYIGEIGLLAESPHESTARARTHCVVYQLRRDAIAGLLETNAEVAAALEKAVRRGLELVSRKVAATAAGDVGIRGQLVQRIRRFFRSAAG